MTPKPWACRDSSSSTSIHEVSIHEHDEKTTNECGAIDEEKKDCLHDDISRIIMKKRTIMKKKKTVIIEDEVDVASSTNYRQMLEHSFSYNDLSHFNIEEMKSQPKRYPEPGARP